MQEYAHCWFIGKILKNINLVNMKKLMLFLLLLFSINVTAQNVVDSVSVAETDDGKQLWGKISLVSAISYKKMRTGWSPSFPLNAI